MSASQSSVWKPTILLVFLLVPIANYLPFAFGADQFGDGPTTRVDAAGYAFSIWGVIFLGMIAFAWNVFRQKDGPASVHLHRALPALVIAGLASITFVPISIYGDQVVGWIDIVVHLVALVYANVQLRRHVAAVPSTSAWRWTYFAPSLYLGWISAASVISSALFLDSLGIRFSPEVEIIGATALVVVLTLLGSYLVFDRDFFYGATVAWALIAVSVKQADADLIFYSSWVGVAVLATFILWKRAFYAAPGYVKCPEEHAQIN